MRYRIISITPHVLPGPHSHPHIAKVGIGDPAAGCSALLTVEQVYAAMDRGDDFYTQSPSTGRIARVFKCRCPHCLSPSLRSAPNALADNNLESLPAAPQLGIAPNEDGTSQPSPPNDL